MFLVYLCRVPDLIVSNDSGCILFHVLILIAFSLYVLLCLMLRVGVCLIVSGSTVPYAMGVLSLILLA